MQRDLPDQNSLKYLPISYVQKDQKTESSQAKARKKEHCRDIGRRPESHEAKVRQDNKTETQHELSLDE